MQACLSASCDDFESETEPAEPLLRHWPFFGCSQLVAAFGYVVAIAAGNENPEMDYGSPLAHLAGTHQNPESPLNSGAATQYPAQESSFPQMPTIAVDSASTWAQRMALSNITFALANLERLSVVWPVCLILRDEVRRCRDALDFGGPTGLGSPRR